MRPTQPPPAATSLLKIFGPRNEALMGDLLEEYRRGERSVGWYWRQVMIAIVMGRSTEILFTLIILSVYRIGNFVSVHGANTKALALLGRHAPGIRFHLYDLFTGGNLSPVTVFALGIVPYIQASLIVQVVVSGWRRLIGRTSPPGRLRVRYTWYTALLLCVVQASGLAFFLEHQSNIAGGLQLVYDPGWVFRITLVGTLR